MRMKYDARQEHRKDYWLAVFEQLTDACYHNRKLVRNAQMKPVYRRFLLLIKTSFLT